MSAGRRDGSDVSGVADVADQRAEIVVDGLETVAVGRLVGCDSGRLGLPYIAHGCIIRSHKKYKNVKKY